MSIMDGAATAASKRAQHAIIASVPLLVDVATTAQAQIRPGMTERRAAKRVLS